MSGSFCCIKRSLRCRRQFKSSTYDGTSYRSRMTFASLPNELYWSSLDIDEVSERRIMEQPNDEAQTQYTSPTIVPLNSQYESIPSDVATMVNDYSRKQPTALSLQMLIQTGKGQHSDFWGRSYHSASNKHIRSSSTSPNLMMITSPHRRLGLDTHYSKERIQIQMADFLRKELPIRLAHRIQDLDQVPHLRHMEAVQAVKNIYIHSLLQITNTIPPSIRSIEEENSFATLLTSLYENHANVLVQMAKGAYQLRTEIRRQQKEQQKLLYRQTQVQAPYNQNQQYAVQTSPTSTSSTTATTVIDSFAQMNDCHEFLDRFYMSRIGIRFLAAQYLTLRNSYIQSKNEHNQLKYPSLLNQQSLNNSSSKKKDHTYIGMICQETSPSQCVRQAAMDASMMCRRLYGRCPHVEVTGRLDLTFPYIPTYLHYIVLELLKNALRATMEVHQNNKDAALPPVQVTIADGVTNEDVVVKISDCGGGIPRSQIDQIWSYLYTTADPKIQELFVGNDGHSSLVKKNDTKTTNYKGSTKSMDHGFEAPLAGLGYGLPISRSYCRYFGGDLDIISMEGYGTDAFVYLKRLGDSKEPVPI